MKTQRLLFGCQNDHQDTHPDIDLASSLPLLICRSGFSFFSFRRKARQIPDDNRTKLFKALNAGTYPRSCTTMDNHGSTSIADFLTYVPLQPLPPSRSPSPYQHILPSGSPHLFFTFFQDTQTLNYFPPSDSHHEFITALSLSSSFTFLDPDNLTAHSLLGFHARGLSALDLVVPATISIGRPGFFIFSLRNAVFSHNRA